MLNRERDSDGRSVNRLDLSDDRERLEREQRALARKDYESNNWEKQRRRVADAHVWMSNQEARLQAQARVLLHHEYDAVFVEDLNVRGMLEGPGNARNKAEV